MREPRFCGIPKFIETPKGRAMADDVVHLSRASLALARNVTLLRRGEEKLLMRLAICSTAPHREQTRFDQFFTQGH
jgi:hypothetical protein